MSTSAPPRFSVIIPAYNAAPYLGRAIESALAQTWPPFEILVVDDGSQDNTAEVAASYPHPVRVIRRENGGPAAARNEGARQARGDWLALLDADDSWLPGKLALQAPKTGDPQVAVVHGPREDAPLLPPAELSFEALWDQNLVLNSSAVIRKSCFEAVGALDEDRALIGVEDYNLWLRLAAAGWKIVSCSEALCRYTPAAGNLSSQSTRFALAELANARKVARVLVLDPAMLRAKELRIQDEYGRELFYFRRMSEARRFLLAALRQSPSAGRLAWWCASFLPPAVLDAHRTKA